MKHSAEIQTILKNADGLYKKGYLYKYDKINILSFMIKLHVPHLTCK